MQCSELRIISYIAYMTVMVIPNYPPCKSAIPEAEFKNLSSGLNMVGST